MSKALSDERTAQCGRGLGLGALLLMAVLLSGCNTARGVGEDASAAGGAVMEPFQDDDEDAAQSS